MQENLNAHLPDDPLAGTPEELLAQIKIGQQYFQAMVTRLTDDRPLMSEDALGLSKIMDAMGAYSKWKDKLIKAIASGKIDDEWWSRPEKERQQIRAEVRRILHLENVQINALAKKIYLAREKEQSARFVLRRLRAENAAKPKDAMPQPPLNAQFLLYLFLEKESREEAVGDQLESYSTYLKRFGKVRANLIFYGEVARCAWPFIKRVVTSLGLVSLLIELLRKLASWWLGK